MAEKKHRRGNARQARLAARASTIKSDPPIRVGMSGGAYKPLSDHDLKRVHDTSLDVLEKIGIGTPIPLLVDLASKRGAWMSDTGRLCFPRELMEDIVAGAAKEITLYGRDPQYDLDISGTKVHYGTGGAAISVLDFESGNYRPSTLTDIYDFARLCDQLDNVNWFTRCVIATELPDPYELDINTAYALVKGTKKHIGTAITVAENVKHVTELFDMVAGGTGKFKERPFCKLHTSPMVPPLRYGDDACDTIVEAIHHGWTINAITAGQSGATSPATLAGTLVQTNAETLAALAMVNIIKPGHPFIYSNWPFVADLRTGSMTGGSAEGAVLNAAAAQIINSYDLPSGVVAGMTDSKIPDAQAAYENAITNTLAGLSGANLIYESSGMLASLLGASYEAFVINDEIIGNIIRCNRGIEITEETLSFEVIKDAVEGAGHFLGNDQTINVMETEYLYPKLGDRLPPAQWEELGKQDMWQKAKVKVTELMQNYPDYITEEQDRQLRERFPNIALVLEVTEAGNGRW